MMMRYMSYALKEAAKAADEGEVPVGCIIIKDGKVIAASHNTVESSHDATCHAEINAIKAACEKTGEKTLADCEMYVTLEPCPMCAGAVISAKIKRIYIGAQEPKSGCFGSVCDFSVMKFNHKPEIYIGINEDECSQVLKNFFKNKR